jgi:glutathione peroxidase
MFSFLSKFFSMVIAMMSPSMVAGPAPQRGSAFDFAFTSIDGTPLPLKAFEGRVLLVVNTASLCGFTPQYKGLQGLSETYEGKGLTIIGVPSNDFGGQEPKSGAEIKTFCQGAFGVTFPLTEKAVVKGDGAHPLYRWVVSVLGPKAAPSWNFHKYLIARDGRIVAAFSSGVEPSSGELTSAIEAELAKPAAVPSN